MFAKLRGAIREKFGRQAAFAKAMDMSPATLSKKLCGETEWTRKEMEDAGRLLGFSPAENHTYFF